MAEDSMRYKSRLQEMESINFGITVRGVGEARSV